MSTSRIRIHYVIMDMRNLEYMSRGDSYNDISYAEMFPTYVLAKESLKTYDDDIRDYLKIYKVEERTEWRLSLVDEAGD